MSKKIIDSYLPCDTWLYYKIYCGIKIADEILVSNVHFLCKELIESKSIKSFFFIRYCDPKPHLRLRLLITSMEHLYEIVSRVNYHFKPFIQENLIGGLQIDSYKRELERYNIDSIQNSEKIFCLESKMLLEYLLHEKQYDDRLYFVISLVDFYLTKVNLSIEGKKQFAEKMKCYYSKEFSVDSFFKRNLEAKYRVKRTQIDKYLFSQEDTIISKLIQEYSSAMEYNLNAIKETPSVNIEYLHYIIQSHIHMLVNRAFRGNQRLFELIVYDFMIRSYKSKIARLKCMNADNDR
ncbi:thiopeptide-type bacteriocin biosynthesis protein [Labilibaculum sp. K2S]|uniref:thiopeptide-type bacteriocin biosynthesis protein n=1 Tax=Labilibaculum sp. K2S TaxID=3056386 RepID=UPI0025A35208|nr:thiopeptide-type bacteriocin biosynthesis protein [Labilibaculum sp. K2S]MDM8160359.1 thiopeptide-type bacteriocin biosynthesis protein [Labilibaculum sp. K2S]